MLYELGKAMKGSEIVDRLKDAAEEIDATTLTLGTKPVKRTTTPYPALIGLPDRTIDSDGEFPVGILIKQEAKHQISDILSRVKGTEMLPLRLPEPYKFVVKLPYPIDQRFEDINGNRRWVDGILNQDGILVTSRDKLNKFVVVTARVLEPFMPLHHTAEERTRRLIPDIEEIIKKYLPGLKEYPLSDTSRD